MGGSSGGLVFPSDFNMNNKTILTIDVFDPKETLVALFESKSVEFKYLDKNPAFKIAKDRSLEVIGDPSVTSQIVTLATTLVAWLEANADRKIQAQMNDCTIVYLEGLPTEDVISILKNTIKLIAFDLEYNNSIGRTNKY